MSSGLISNPDVVLVGSGIMSSTLGALLKCLHPQLRIQLLESGTELAGESSHGWNNAGTGHAGLCELSYTPHRTSDGSVDVRKAVEIFSQFEVSRQFWAFAVSHGLIRDPRQFIRSVPHMSFVWGAEQVAFLRDRYAAMSKHPFFQGMQFSEDPEVIQRWTPLLMAERPSGPVAATRAETGTDVNFGVLSRELAGWLGQQPGCNVATGHRVEGLGKLADGRWKIQIRTDKQNRLSSLTAAFVFVGAGGGTLPLLQKTGIPESRGIGGFPVGGQWLVCENPEIIRQHHAKVYGQALGAAPTMAVPHLDTRVIDGKEALLFGPFAAWTTKFLHGSGSHLDLPRSVKGHNLLTLLQTGAKNLDLIRYLRQQGTQSKTDRLHALRDFYPAARDKDWRLIDAGIRVQAIRKTDGKAGIVHYGTEVLTSTDRSLAGLLGASPGASVSTSIALDVIATCFPNLLVGDDGEARVRAVIPTWHVNLEDSAHVAFYREASRQASATLQLAAG